MTLTLVVTDFFLERGGLPDDVATQLPALPALTSLLRRGGTPWRAAGWREGLAARHGIGVPLCRQPARIAATALDVAGATDRAVAFAQPVHRVAGMSRVTLHPAGLLQLLPEERRELSESFNATLGGSALRLAEAGEGLLLAGAFDVIDDGERRDPAAWLGRELEGGLHGLPATLQRLGAEVEMWLLEHPLNQSRQARGALPANALWFWGTAPVDTASTAGGAAVSEVAAGKPQRPEPAPQLLADDPFARGLWCLLDAPQRAGVSSFAKVPTGAACVVVSAAAQAPGDRVLERLERDWFEPIHAALDAGRLHELSLWLGAREWRIGSPRWHHGLRRSHPWWIRATA